MEEKKVVYFDDVKKDIWKKKAKDALNKAKDGCIQAANWVKDNPATVASIASGTAIVATKLTKHSQIRSEERRRERSFYDPRTGVYTYAKRDLSAREKKEIVNRHQRGEAYSDILYDMHLTRR